MTSVASRASMVDVFKRNKVLPALLAEKGYVSFQSGKWWEGRPEDFGFTKAMTHGDVARQGRHGDEGLTIGRQGLQPIYDFIDSAAGNPFFVWYAPFLPHTPHTPPDRLLKKYQAPDVAPPVARYYAMIEWLDETVGQLWTTSIVVAPRQHRRHYLADNGWIQSPGPQPPARKIPHAAFDPVIAGLCRPRGSRREDASFSIDVMLPLRAAGIRFS
jgi:uncharacterized sulfatase